ncbi:MAG: DUF262 domain-containing protein [Gammaproteobacteria bacterium]|nr:DUF262 domain-containing protein [Gammaproteobacteria bacterium]MCY4268577.1 DUF262 domain-containing protein [Gammaproteobacteria bacterium]
MTERTVEPLLPNKHILSVRDFLAVENLRIPKYQRPYKWTPKNVNQLFNDIAVHKNKSCYRLGTIVLHREGDEINIVDGQQRTITLLLIVLALSNTWKERLERKDLKEQLSELENEMISFSFTSELSKDNIHTNYREIWRIVDRSDFTEDQIDFLLNKCTVVTFVLKDVSEAFQFFDSQNARGKDLEPHDLLKAYHLREFHSFDDQLKALTVGRWEKSETHELAMLFSQYLYRIRNWSTGVSARYFGKEDIRLFKGVNLETVARYRYVAPLHIVHNFVDNYNQHYERKVDNSELTYPFSLDQTIVNGRRFFEMIAHYQDLIEEYNRNLEDKHQLAVPEKLDGYADQILEVLKNYEGRNRIGDRYVRTIFDCLLIYYIDKFGFMEISRAIEKTFIWAYSLRLKMQAVQVASMDNHVLKDNLFKLIRDAIHPNEFISYSLPILQEPKSRKTKKIQNLFQKMGYYGDQIA